MKSESQTTFSPLKEVRKYFQQFWVWRPATGWMYGEIYNGAKTLFMGEELAFNEDVDNCPARGISMPIEDNPHVEI